MVSAGLRAYAEPVFRGPRPRPSVLGRMGDAEVINLDPAAFDVLIEIPRGSRNKYEVDHASGRIRLDRTLFRDAVLR